MTKYEQITALPLEEFAVFLSECGFGCHVCPERERLESEPYFKYEACDGNCSLHCREMLEREVPE